jgi:hydroxysqualene dehydroxylase
VYLQYPPHVKLRLPMIGCTNKLTQWFFDRGQLSPIDEPADGLIAAVISASGAHETLDHAALAMRVHAELEEIAGSIPPFAWHKVVAEKFATFACTPAAQNTLRPSATTDVAGLFLAGDYVACDYPATLEAAVRNGVAAAELSAKFISKSSHD